MHANEAQSFSRCACSRSEEEAWPTAIGNSGWVARPRRPASSASSPRRGACTTTCVFFKSQVTSTCRQGELPFLARRAGLWPLTVVTAVADLQWHAAGASPGDHVPDGGGTRHQRHLLPFGFQVRCALVQYQSRSASVCYVARRHGRCGIQSDLLHRTPLTAKLGKLHPERLRTCALDPA